MQEDFAATVFGNNYSRPVIGYQGDLDAMGRREVAAFHGRHYAPQNLTVALVGDVDPAQARWPMRNGLIRVLIRVQLRILALIRTSAHSAAVHVRGLRSGSCHVAPQEMHPMRQKAWRVSHVRMAQIALWLPLVPVTGMTLCAPALDQVRMYAISRPGIHVAQAQRFAEAYFGDWSCGTDSICAARAQPREQSARPASGVNGAQAPRFERAERSGPAAMLAYYRPGLSHPDAVALDVIRCCTLILASVSDCNHRILLSWASDRNSHIARCMLSGLTPLNERERQPC